MIRACRQDRHALFSGVRSQSLYAVSKIANPKDPEVTEHRLSSRRCSKGYRPFPVMIAHYRESNTLTLCLVLKRVISICTPMYILVVNLDMYVHRLVSACSVIRYPQDAISPTSACSYRIRQTDIEYVSCCPRNHILNN